MVIGYAPQNQSGEVAAARSWVPPAHFAPKLLLIGAALISSLGAVVQPVTEADFWWHVRVGRWIVEHGHLPGHDLFTYTVSDHRWVDHEYLTEVLTWLLQARFGLTGVSIAFGLLIWLGLVFVLLASRPRRHPYVIVGLAVVLALVAGAPIWGPRPQMVTFVLVSLELLWLRRFLEGSSRAVIWLPPLMALWSNLHGGWPVGFLFLGIAVLSELIHGLGDRSGAEHLRRARILLIVGALSALAVLVNPNGLSVYAYPLQTLTSAAQRDLIAEWLSPNFHLPELRAFEVLLVLVVAGLVLGRTTLFELLAVLAAVVLALESVRHVALFVATATPVLVASWSEVWRRLAARMSWSRPASPSRRWLSAVTVAVLALVAIGVTARTVDNLRRQPALTSQSVPTGAADWLAAHPEVGTRMFNQYAWGGYLADRFYPIPNRRVFLFSEGVLMGDELLFRYRRVAAVSPGWQEVLDQAGVDYVVFDAGSALDEVLSIEPSWRLAYRDATAVIYVRAAP